MNVAVQQDVAAWPDGNDSIESVISSCSKWLEAGVSEPHSNSEMKNLKNSAAGQRPAALSSGFVGLLRGYFNSTIF